MTKRDDLNSNSGNSNPRTTLICGALSGLISGFSIYPLDTLKTRLQSGAGFYESGGFKRIYAGVVPGVIGSAPGAALFFLTYESIKRLSESGAQSQSNQTSSSHSPMVHSVAAGVAEIAACLVRVPAEVVKQRAQASELSKSQNSFQVARKVAAEEGFLGFYRGFSVTVFRGLPCVLLQFPLWESMKHYLWIYQNQQSITPFQSAVCGATAGVIGGALTLPLDVAKTRIILTEASSSNVNHSKSIPANLSSASMIKTVYQTEGLSALYSGGLVRSLWTFAGSLIFFGAYEQSKIWFLRRNSCQIDEIFN